MATVREIFNYIDSFAPFNTQEEWDNSGLLVGDKNKSVNKIMFALDITTEVINQAVDKKCDLIVTHHPVIFKAVSNVLSDSLVYKLIQNNISIICAHTNYDKAVGGVNDILCDLIGVENYEKVEHTCLNVAMLGKSYSSNNFAKILKEKLNCDIRYNSFETTIEKIAVCSGSGSEYLKLANELNCNALVIGDASHHAFLDADEMKINIFACGHFETENIAIRPLLERIKKQFNIECVLAIQNSPIKRI